MKAGNSRHNIADRSKQGQSKSGYVSRAKTRLLMSCKKCMLGWQVGVHQWVQDDQIPGSKG
jgi:hypothetical protein